MAELDLIPADYAQRQILLRRVRRFVAAVVSLACLLVLARGMLHLLTSAETGEVARLQGQERLWAQSKAQAEEYRKQKLATQRQLIALDELRGRDRLRLFLKAVDAAHLENVWFDEIRYYRRDNLPTGNLPESSWRPRKTFQRRERPQRRPTSSSASESSGMRSITPHWRNSCAGSRASAASPT